ncbi:MAG: heavy-metal-associated domain-containing protein [Parvularcula sp.]
MRKVLFIGAAIAASAFGGITVVAQSSGDAIPAASAEATEATARFSVERMTCATCPISVRKAMKRVDGVKSVKVNFKTKIATVIYDPTIATPTQIAAASTKVGYPAAEIKS